VGVRARRLLVWGVLLAVLAGGIAYALRPQPLAVDLAVVDRGLLRVTIDEEGEARVADVYTLYAPLSGWLDRIDAEAGDPVEANRTELARIEPAPPELLDFRSEAEGRAAVEAADAARTLAQAELQRAEADLAFAESDLERSRLLRGQGNIPERAMDDAERAFQVADATVATAQAALAMRESELEQARSRLLGPWAVTAPGESCACVPVTAPVSGEVLRVMRESEGVVAAGTPLLEIGDPHSLEIVVDLLSEDAVTIEPGQPAIITGWGGPDLGAIARRIEPFGRTEVSALGIEEQRVDVVLDLTDPPHAWHRLGHGYRVDVRLILYEAEVERLPIGALFRNGDGWAVFVADDGVARMRQVEIGARNDLHVEVTGGVEAGEQVVLYPASDLADGVAILPR
jgi:HlyD family secretion protein